MTERLESVSVPPRFDPAVIPGPTAAVAFADSTNRRAHIVVVGNEKGGTGKSTTAMHLVVGLLREGRRVGSIDIDPHQASLTRYVENRRKFAANTKTELQIPDHRRFDMASVAEGTEPPDRQEARFTELLDRMVERNDVIVIDCPGSDTPVARLAVSHADTLITPLNDSFVDLDLLARFEGAPPRIVHIGHFAELVWQAKKRRARRDGGRLDWVVMRNRYNSAATRNRQAIGVALDQLSERLGFRIADGFGERVIFRELFLLGLTMLDFRVEEPMIAHSPSHLAAFEEAMALVVTAAVPRPAKPRPAAPRPAERAPATPEISDADRPGVPGESDMPDTSDPANGGNGSAAIADAPPDYATGPDLAAGQDVAAATEVAAGQRHVLVIYNPVSGWRNRRRFRATLRHLAVAGCAVAVLETSGRGEAESLARAALDEEFDAIVAAGGDGTVNEVANALAGSGKAMGVLPLGTLNVLAAEIGLPSDPRRIAQVIVAGRPRRIHLGRAGDRRFSIAAGVGFDAQVVARVTPRAKRLLGRSAYVLHSLLQLFSYRRVRYKVTVDGREFMAAAVVIANGHYYAGRLAYAPGARLDDPRLHVCLFARPGRWNVIRYRLALLMGRLPRLPDVQVLPANVVEIVGEEGEPIHADGEIVGQLPARFDVAREELSVLAPG